MKEVKSEIFGTRPKVLEALFARNGTSCLKHFWLATCRQVVNCDPDTRYVVFFESLDAKTSIDTSCLSWFTERMHNRIFSVYLDKSSQKVHRTCLRSSSREELTYNEFKQWILKFTHCRDEASAAQGTSESTPLSRFFRGQMGRAFSLTDVDYIIPHPDNPLFIEEKFFASPTEGYLGQGQALSFSELTNHVLQKKCSLSIATIRGDRIFVNDFRTIDISKTKVLPEWGTMVGFPLGKSLTTEEFLRLIKTGIRISGDREGTHQA